MGVICVAIRLALVFERPTLRGCQCGCVIGRVKTLHILTLPYQKTNPDGVIEMVSARAGEEIQKSLPPKAGLWISVRRSVNA